MAEDSARKGMGAFRLLKGLAMLEKGALDGLLFDGRGDLVHNPYEHARAVGQVTAALAELSRSLPPAHLRRVRDAVAELCRADWPTAAAVALALGEVATTGPAQALHLVTGTLVRLAAAEPPLARQMADRLPLLLQRSRSPDHRIHLLLALDRASQVAPDVAPTLAAELPALVDELPPKAMQAFLDRALELAPEGRAKVRSFLLRESQEGRAVWETLRTGLPLHRVARTLQLYAEAHCGNGVRIRSLDTLPEGGRSLGDLLSLTDGNHIYLAPRVLRYPDEERNFRLYKLATAHEAGHIEFGTFRLDPTRVRRPAEPEVPTPGVAARSPVARFLAGFHDRDLAARLFMLMEDSRIDDRLRSHYPGLARDMDGLAEDERSHRPPLDSLPERLRLLEVLARMVWFDDDADSLQAGPELRAAWQLALLLRRADATVEDAADAAVHAYDMLVPLMPEGAPAWLERGDSEGAAEGAEGDTGPPQPSSTRSGALEHAGTGTLPFQGMLALDLDGVLEDAEVRRAERIQRVLQERGVDVPLAEVRRQVRGDPDQADSALERSILESHRDRARRRPEGRGRGDGAPASAAGGDESASGQEEGRIVRYPEWDWSISDYRPGWTAVRERASASISPDFAAETHRRHASLVARLRRQFQMIRAQQRGLTRGWTEGDEIDLDAVVTGLAERRAGIHPSDRIYTRRLRPDRSVAVAFLVDLSASTKEAVGQEGLTVIDVQKQALILLAAALDALGDRYAVYGFSGRGRSQVDFEIAKSFDDPSGDWAAARIGGLHHQMENRDGAAIRHATRLLAREPARVRLLVLLSDGRPLDCGCERYHDRYAQDDTRMALREALALRVNPFCITVDRRGEDYLQAMYGDVGYTVIDRVEGLPERLPAIYRRLTT